MPEPRPPLDAARRVFLDWAGDPGLQLRHGSSDYLVVAAIFTDRYPALKVVLDQWRRERGLSSGYWFHFSHSTNDLRRRFRSALVDLPITARVVVAEKEPLQGFTAATLLARTLAESVVGANRELVEGATVLVDGSREDAKLASRMRVAVSRLCEERGLDYRPGKLRVRPASEEDGLQVADMVAGMIMHGLAAGVVAPPRSLGRKIDVIDLRQTQNRPG